MVTEWDRREIVHSLNLRNVLLLKVDTKPCHSPITRGIVRRNKGKHLGSFKRGTNAC
jgi:hypothetical protein